MPNKRKAGALAACGDPYVAAANYDEADSTGGVPKRTRDAIAAQAHPSRTTTRPKRTAPDDAATDAPASKRSRIADDEQGAPARKTRITGVESALREQHPKTQVRHSNIAVGLMATLAGYEHGKPLGGIAKQRLDLFDAIAKRVGTMRFVVGLLANAIVLDSPDADRWSFSGFAWKDATVNKKGQETTPARVKQDPAKSSLPKTFFDQIWSAADRWVCKKLPREGNLIDADVAHKLDDWAWPRDTLAPLEFNIRQDTTRAMSVSMLEHLKLVPRRARATLKHELYHQSYAHNKDAYHELARKAARCVFDGDATDDDLNACVQLGVDAAHRKVMEGVLREHRGKVTSAREWVRRAMCRVVPSGFEYEVPAGQLTITAIASDAPHALLAYAIFVSRRVDALHDLYAADDALRARARYLPRRFALLPMWKHQPAFVKYGATQFDRVPSVRDSVLCPKDKTTLELVTGALFDLRRVGGRKRHDLDAFALDGFSTNGVQLVLHYKASDARRPAAPPTWAVGHGGSRSAGQQQQPGRSKCRRPREGRVRRD